MTPAENRGENVNHNAHTLRGILDLGLLDDLEPNPGDVEPINVDAIKNEDIACVCNNVTAGEVREVIRSQTASDLAGVQRCTRATGGCGMCLPVITALVDAELTARQHNA